MEVRRGDHDRAPPAHLYMEDEGPKVGSQMKSTEGLPSEGAAIPGWALHGHIGRGGDSLAETVHVGKSICLEIKWPVVTV